MGQIAAVLLLGILALGVRAYILASVAQVQEAEVKPTSPRKHYEEH